MKKNKYLKDVGDECSLSSSKSVYGECKLRNLRLKGLPTPGICQGLSSQSKKRYFAWRFFSQKGSHLVSIFKGFKMEMEQEIVMFQQMESGDFFLRNDVLYQVAFEQDNGFVIKYVSVLFHERYAYALTRARNINCTKFELCALYDVSAPEDMKAVCWVGHTVDGGKIFVKLFQNDVVEFKKMNLFGGLIKPIAIGKTFFVQNMWWRLLQDRNGQLYIEEAVVLSCKQKRQDKAEEQLAEDEKNVCLR